VLAAVERSDEVVRVERRGQAHVDQVDRGVVVDAILELPFGRSLLPRAMANGVPQVVLQNVHVSSDGLDLSRVPEPCDNDRRRDPECRTRDAARSQLPIAATRC